MTGSRGADDVENVKQQEEPVEDAEPDPNACEPRTLTYEELLPYLLLPIGGSF
jgi:hypothetical protein